MEADKVESHGAVVGQVDCRVRPPAPMRAVRLTLKLDADDMRELSYGAQWRANAHRFRADAITVQSDALRVRDMQRDSIAASEESDQP